MGKSACAPSSLLNKIPPASPAGAAPANPGSGNHLQNPVISWNKYLRKQVMGLSNGKTTGAGEARIAGAKGEVK